VVDATTQLERLQRQYTAKADQLKGARAALHHAEAENVNGRDEPVIRAKALLSGRSLEETRHVPHDLTTMRRGIADLEGDVETLDQAIYFAGQQLDLARIEAEQELARRKIPEYRALVAGWRRALTAVEESTEALAQFRAGLGPLGRLFPELEVVAEAAIPGSVGQNALVKLKDLVRKGLAGADDYLESTGKDHA
jgi:hypothetical protein